MTERTTVSESMAKKICFAGEESGVGFVVARKKHAETRGFVGTFPLWNKEKHAKHAKSVIGLSGLKYVQMDWSGMDFIVRK